MFSSTFRDGPAAGVQLTLRRAPALLRVVCLEQADGNRWDALDQRADEPRARERVFVYIRVGRERQCFLDFKNPGGPRRGSYSEAGDYEMVVVQPDEAVLRSNVRWRYWCEDVGPSLVAAHNAAGVPAGKDAGS